jgi:saccharopine dehydrogenase-like NADP-dependent oxidoreductase
MAFKTFRYENGTHVTDKPFSRPLMMTLRGIERKVRMVDHEHDEPVSMGLLADNVLKGVKNVDFKYGGSGVELAEVLYKMGLLSTETVTVKDTCIVPMDLVLKLCPPAPKYPEEIKAIIDAGIILEEGAFLVRVDGHKQGSPVRIDCYVNAPGLVESFEKAGLSHEAYLTGQCASVFVKLMVDDVFVERGLYAPEQLDAASRRYYFQELAKLGVTVDEIIERKLA